MLMLGEIVALTPRNCLKPAHSGPLIDRISEQFDGSYGLDVTAYPSFQRVVYRRRFGDLSYIRKYMRM